MPEDVKLQLAGRMLIVVDLEDWGPMEWRINEDPDLVADVLRLIIERTENSFSVDSYKAAYGRKLKAMLEGKK
jgi:hypothetical protein